MAIRNRILVQQSAKSHREQKYGSQIRTKIPDVSLAIRRGPARVKDRSQIVHRSPNLIPKAARSHSEPVQSKMSSGRGQDQGQGHGPLQSRGSKLPLGSGSVHPPSPIPALGAFPVQWLVSHPSPLPYSMGERWGSRATEVVFRHIYRFSSFFLEILGFHENQISRNLT